MTLDRATMMSLVQGRYRRGSGCWPWTHTRNSGGYGVASRGGRQYMAHRLLFELNRGPIPDGLQVLHRCDNPRCVRPSHLFLGTIGDNMRDRTAKGRQARGERNGGGGKLTAAAVRRIRRLLSRGLDTKTDIGARFGVTRQCVRRIERGILWRHIA